MVKNKIIYFHEKDTCHIVAVWGCRNNPQTYYKISLEKNK